MFERPSTSFIRKSQENQYLNSDDQTDIFVYDTRFGVNVDLDVLLARPFSKDTINQTAKKIDLQLPKERRSKKKEKYLYSSQEHSSLYHATFIPLAFDHCGCWGKEAESYLDHLARRVRNQDGRLNEVHFV